MPARRQVLKRGVNAQQAMATDVRIFRRNWRRWFTVQLLIVGLPKRKDRL